MERTKSLIKSIIYVDLLCEKIFFSIVVTCASVLDFMPRLPLVLSIERRREMRSMIAILVIATIAHESKAREIFSYNHATDEDSPLVER